MLSAEESLFREFESMSDEALPCGADNDGDPDAAGEIPRSSAYVGGGVWGWECKEPTEGESNS